MGLRSAVSYIWEDEVVRTFLIILSCIAALSALIVYGGSVIGFLVAEDARGAPNYWKVIGGGLILMSGYALWELREVDLYSYAWIELIFGIMYGLASAWTIGYPMDITATSGFTLVGCVYVIVRGATNLKEAKKKEARPTWHRWLTSALRRFSKGERPVPLPALQADDAEPNE